MALSKNRSPDKRWNQAAFIDDSQPDVDSLVVFGDIDMANAPDFDTALEGLPLQDGPLVVDLRNCKYLDSCGIKILIKHQRRRTQFRVLVLRGSTIARILEVAHLSELVHLELSPCER